MKGKQRRKLGLAWCGTHTRPFDTGFYKLCLVWEHPILEAWNSPELCAVVHRTAPMGQAGFGWASLLIVPAVASMPGKTGSEHVN